MIQLTTGYSNRSTKDGKISIGFYEKTSKRWLMNYPKWFSFVRNLSLAGHSRHFLSGIDLPLSSCPPIKFPLAVLVTQEALNG